MTPRSRGWRAILADLRTYLGRRVPQELEIGSSYMCRVAGETPELAVGEVVSADAWVEPAHLPGEALSQVFNYAVLQDSTGNRRTVPRADVLWRVEDHAAISLAASALGVSVLPSSVRGAPTWRLGAVRVSVADMVELGRLLVLR